MPKQSYSNLLIRNKELEKEIESLKSSYDATLLCMKEKLKQLQVDVAKHETSISDHSASLFHYMFGGEDYITEEIASILASMVTRPYEHTLLDLSASPLYRIPPSDDLTFPKLQDHLYEH